MGTCPPARAWTVYSVPKATRGSERERARAVLGLLGVLNSSANFPSEFAVVVVVVCEMRVTIGKIKCIINH